MNDWQMWAVGVGVTIFVAVLLRVAKKRMWAEKCQLAGERVGMAFSVLLMRWLPPVAAEKAEEGIVVTAIELARSFLDGFQFGILSDNNKRKKKGGGK